MVNDTFFMQRCLELAERGRGAVGNGAMVGAVLVRHGVIIAEGYHDHFDGPHAELALLEKFDQKIRSTDILYVNLEPCCHHGKTPPCTDLLVARGVKRVVVGMTDPDGRVAGQGLAQLRSAGIAVSGPVLLCLCEHLNRGFISVRTLGRPWVTLKRAQTKGGAIAHDDGKPMKITSPEQDAWSHMFIRAQHEAILVGVGTIINDDPKLNIRFVQEYKSSTVSPYRIILDPQLRIPLTARVVTDELRDRTIVITASTDDLAKRNLRARGVMVFDVALQNGCFDWRVLWDRLITPEGGYHGLTSVLVEGGRRTWEIFRSAGMIDEEVTLVGC